VSFWLGSSGAPTPSRGLPSAALALRRAGALPRKNRRFFASRPRCRSALFRGPYPAGPEVIPHLNSFAILAPVPRSLRSGAGTPTPLFPSLSPARRFRPPRARASLLRARCVVPPCSPARSRDCPVFGPPPLFASRGPYPWAARGGRLPGSRQL